MSPSEPRRETSTRRDVARSAHRRSEISTTVTSDPRMQATVKADRTMHELVIEAQQRGEAVIVLLAGEFDLAAADPIREALALAIGEPRQRLIVDLSAVTFIDSSGLHVILDAYKLCRDAGRALTIRPGPPNVHRVFALTNFLERLPFEGGD